MIKNKFFRSVMSLGLIAGLALGTPITAQTAQAGDNYKEYKNSDVDTRSYDAILKAIQGTDNSDYSKNKTVFIQTTDVHGAIDKYSCVRGLKDKLLEDTKNVDVVLVDCGDFLYAKENSNDPEVKQYEYVNKSKGLAPMILMNAVGYDYATIGNHEFEFSADKLKTYTDNANFNITSANLYKNNALLYAPNFIYQSPSTPDFQIGLFGMTAPETKGQKSGNIKGISVGDNREDKQQEGIPTLSATAKEQAEYLEANSDLVICLSHLGVKSDDSRSSLKTNRSVDMYYDLMNNETGHNPIDLILDGHSHTLLTAGGGYLDSEGRPVKELGKNDKPNTALEPIISTGIRMPSVGVVVIDNASKTIEDRFLVSTDELRNANIINADVDNLYKAVKDRITDNDALQAFLIKQHEAYTNGQPLPTASDLTGETTEDTTEPEDDDKDKTNETTEVTDQETTVEDTTVEETTEEPTQDVQEPEAPSDKDPRAGHHEPSSHDRNGRGGRSSSGHNSGHSSRNNHSHHHHH